MEGGRSTVHGGERPSVRAGLSTASAESPATWKDRGVDALRRPGHCVQSAVPSRAAVVSHRR